MIYPKIHKTNRTIGISAPSAGVGHKLEEYEKAISLLEKEGYQLIQTDHVLVDSLRSAPAEIRAKELHELFLHEEIDTILCATGGDFMMEIHPYMDWKLLKSQPKWIVGYSDPTNLLFPYTTKYDIATIYGVNASSFDDGKKFRYIQDALAILKGEHITQKSYAKIDGRELFSKEPLKFTRFSSWKSSVDKANLSGRCIGGCIDVLKDLLGTPYADISSFQKKYKEDGIIWFFDPFALSAENLYRTFLQMRYAGCFHYTTAVIVGRPLFESSETGMTYSEAIESAFPDIPVFYCADIGHTKPHMTMVCGAIMKLHYENHQASIRFQYR